MTMQEPFLLGKGWVHSRDLIYLYGATRAANEADLREMVVVRWKQGQWGLWQVGTRLCSVCTATSAGERVILVVGIDGYMEISKAGGDQAGLIDNSAEGPNDLRHITFARPIGPHFVAVGMSRMVYRCDVSGGNWQPIDAGVRVPRSSPELAGFKAIDGDGQGRYLAVGLYGEMWLYEGAQWRRLVSPTNVKLEAVKWVGDKVYVAGGGGVLLHGEPDALEIVTHTATAETFWSIEYFEGALYLATRVDSLWRLEGDDLQPVVPVEGRRVTTGWLHANDGIMLSVGEHDAMIFDGKAWTPLEQPAADSKWPLHW